MDIQKRNLATGEEYINFVRSFVTLLDEELKGWEKGEGSKDELEALADRMPLLISLANTVSCLRGQDNVFLDVRPVAPEYIDELYGYEGFFQERLESLAKTLLESDQKQAYQESIHRNFVKIWTELPNLSK